MSKRTLTVRALKVTAVCPADQLAGWDVPAGAPAQDVAIDCNGHVVTAAFKAKTLRKVLFQIAEHGEDQVTVVIQGRLNGSTLTDAGITAQIKGARQEAEAETATMVAPEPEQAPVRTVEVISKPRPRLLKRSTAAAMVEEPVS